MGKNKGKIKDFIMIDPNSYSLFNDTGIKIYDKDVVNYTLRHMRIIDRINPVKVAQAVLYGHTFMSPGNKPDTDNFRFIFKKK